MFYAKIDKSLRKALGPHISSLTDATFNLDELTEWVERNVTMADHEHSGRKTDIAAKAAIFGDVEDDDEDDDGAAYYGRAGGGTGKPIPCKICGSLEHRKSEHPGPCPLKAAPPHGQSCPGNPPLGIPHNDRNSPFGECPFGYFGPTTRAPGKSFGRGAGSSSRGAPRPPPAGFRKPQASLEATEYVRAEEVPLVDAGYTARPAPEQAAEAPMERMYVLAEREMTLRDRALETSDAERRHLMLEQADRMAEARDSLAAVAMTPAIDRARTDASIGSDELGGAQSAHALAEITGKSVKWGDRDDEQVPPADGTVLAVEDCFCGLQACVRTAGRHNGNRGRVFHRCPLSGPRQCAYFVWADGEPDKSNLPAGKPCPVPPAPRPTPGPDTTPAPDPPRKCVHHPCPFAPDATIRFGRLCTACAQYGGWVDPCPACIEESLAAAARVLLPGYAHAPVGQTARPSRPRRHLFSQKGLSPSHR